MDIDISRHAQKRLSQRLGLPYRAHKRHALAAFKDGLIVQPMENFEKMLIEYHDRFYIFGLSKCGTIPVLVTVY